MTVILGLNAFHADSAACLIIDGKLVGAVAEERLGERLKHSPRFPENAVRWLLSSNGIRLREITHVALPRNGAANKGAKLAYLLAHPRKGLPAALEHARRSGKTQSMVDGLARICGEDPEKASFKTVNVEHHLAHIASAYYVSPFEQLTAGFSYDASGDFASAMAARCEGPRIKIESRVTLPDSLGFFYTALCQFIGFDDFGEEYKVMGLASYGDDAYSELMTELVSLPPNGWFRLKRKYFGMHSGGESGAMDVQGRLKMGQLYTKALIDRFGHPGDRRHIGKREKDIARSMQLRFEQAAVHCLTRLHHLVRSPTLVMAGGCALNGVANARILRDTAFEEMYLQPAASDDGTCLGAAYYCWHQVIGRAERFHMQHAFWGPEYTQERLRTVAMSSKSRMIECKSEDDLVNKAARLIADGLITGWFQGRSEWGPRALGNRSILANPAILDMKNTLNSKIKRRESFRPFAPSVLREDIPTYFEQTVDSPFMMHVVKLKPEWRPRLPAITHVDGTGRLQSVDRQSNNLYHSLISAFKKITGLGLVLNTSFNENEPIVDTPEQAMECFKRTRMDALCLGRFILLKSSS